MRFALVLVLFACSLFTGVVGYYAMLMLYIGINALFMGGTWQDSLSLLMAAVMLGFALVGAAMFILAPLTRYLRRTQQPAN